MRIEGVGSLKRIVKEKQSFQLLEDTCIGKGTEYEFTERIREVAVYICFNLFSARATSLIWTRAYLGAIIHGSYII